MGIIILGVLVLVVALVLYLLKRNKRKSIIKCSLDSCDGDSDWDRLKVISDNNYNQCNICLISDNKCCSCNDTLYNSYIKLNNNTACHNHNHEHHQHHKSHETNFKGDLTFLFVPLIISTIILKTIWKLLNINGTINKEAKY